LPASHQDRVQRVPRIPKDGDTGQLGDGRLEQLQLLADDLRADDAGEAGDVPSGPG